MGKEKIALLIIVLILGFSIRLYQLPELMPFIGDQGWFYISARDMLLTGQIPLVGITSSHTWLHQGPLWTYILAFILWISDFNPISGGIFTAILGVITVFMVYKIGNLMFSESVGTISSVLYATSPLVIANDRMPYHTSPIPFFVLLLLFAVYNWIKGKRIFFPITVFLLQVLYNLELATQVLWIVVVSLLVFGIVKKKMWVKNIFNKKILFFSFIGFLIPMLPVVIYDMTHGFPQTFKFILWIPYRVMIFSKGHESIFSMFLFLKNYYQKLVFMPNDFISIIIFFATTINVIFFIFLKYKKRYPLPFPYVILVTFIIVPLLGFIINKTPSEAYLPILFPTVIIATGWLLSSIMKKKVLFIPTLAFLLFMVLFNLLSFATSVENQISYRERMQVATRIVKEAQGKGYNLIGRGRGSEFESFTTNYEYLTWWLGYPPSKKNENLKFFISESRSGVHIDKKE